MFIAPSSSRSSAAQMFGDRDAVFSLIFEGGMLHQG
jgi:hypothetical protein